MQRVCDTKQIWEILAFTGRFDASMFRATLAPRSSELDEDTEEALHDEGEKRSGASCRMPRRRQRLATMKVGASHGSETPTGIVRAVLLSLRGSLAAV